MDSWNQFLEFLSTDPWGMTLRNGLLQLLGAVAILLLGLWIARRLAATLEKLLLKANVDSMLAGFLRKVAAVVLIMLVVVAALDTLGVPAASLFAVLGAAGLAVGLALKDSLGNLAAGVTIIINRPFRKDDVVEIAGLTGKVEQIRLMHTVLVAADNREFVLPNGRVVTEAVINYTARPIRRVDLAIGIAYDDDIAGAMAVIKDVLTADERVLIEPAPTIVLSNLGESSVDLSVRPWAKTADYWGVRSDLFSRVKQALDRAGYSIPFPQRDLHIIGAAPNSAKVEGANAE